MAKNRSIVRGTIIKGVDFHIYANFGEWALPFLVEWQKSPSLTDPEGRFFGFGKLSLVCVSFALRISHG